jgi:hypothetical protein
MTAAMPARGNKWKSPLPARRPALPGCGMPCEPACNSCQMPPSRPMLSTTWSWPSARPPPTPSCRVLQPPAGQDDHRGARRLDRGDDPRPGPPPSRTASLMSLRGRGLWLIGQLVDELRLAKARPGTVVTLHRASATPPPPASCRDGPVAVSQYRPPPWLTTTRCRLTNRCDFRGGT